MQLDDTIFQLVQVLGGIWLGLFLTRIVPLVIRAMISNGSSARSSYSHAGK